MPADFNGYWKMVSNDNFEEYLKALDVNVAVRKIANLLKPDKEILQNGDHMIIKTLSTFRNYIMEFDVGKEFEEDLAGVDDRKCMASKASSPPRGAPFSIITPQEQRVYNPKDVQNWWLEFLRKVKLRPPYLGMEISFFVYRMEKKKVVVGPSGLKEMKCTWKYWKSQKPGKGNVYDRSYHLDYIIRDIMQEIRVCGVKCKQVFKKVQ